MIRKRLWLTSPYPLNLQIALIFRVRTLSDDNSCQEQVF